MHLQLRSSNRSLLVKPKVITKKYGSRIFNGAAARLWNEIIDEELSTPSENPPFSSGVFSVCLVLVLPT